jgi:tryptophanase
MTDAPFRTRIEPFKTKMVEPIHFTTREQRIRFLEEAGHNPFRLAADSCTIDLLTDSGTTAMSAEQWSAMMRADESYAGSASFYRFERVVRELTSLRHVIPTHQGRAAEKILFTTVARSGMVVPNNTHFDTTRANVAFTGAEPVDLVCAAGKDPDSPNPFKGNMDVAKLSSLIERVGRDRIPLVMITVTNNSNGGQPVSLENVRAVKQVTAAHGIPLFLDGCRFAENCWFIRQREAGQQGRPIRDIARELFSLADGCTMSGKKDGLVNIGGFLALNDDAWAQSCRNLLILTEGFPTYGGMAARDMEAMAVGLDEVLDERYLEERVAQVEFLGERLIRTGVPVIRPAGGHAVYVLADRLLPHLAPEQFPGQALVCALFREGGVRATEIGTVMFGRTGPDGQEQRAPRELVRLAIPRRALSNAHLEYVAEVFERVVAAKQAMKGMALLYEPPFLRHFTARFQPLGA